MWYTKNGHRHCVIINMRQKIHAPMRVGGEKGENFLQVKFSNYVHTLS